MLERVKTDQDILIARAEKIAGRKSEIEASRESILVVEFLLIPEKYAIDSLFVTEVLPLRSLTTIPGAPPFVVGIINVRGKIISVINLKSFFNLKEKGISALNRILIIKHGRMEFGIVSDEITGTHQLDLRSLSAPPLTLHGAGVDFIQGLTPQGTILLNPISILSNNTLIVNQK